MKTMCCYCCSQYFFASLPSKQNKNTSRIRNLWMSFKVFLINLKLWKRIATSKRWHTTHLSRLFSPFWMITKATAKKFNFWDSHYLDTSILDSKMIWKRLRRISRKRFKWPNKLRPAIIRNVNGTLLCSTTSKTLNAKKRKMSQYLQTSSLRKWLKMIFRSSGMKSWRDRWRFWRTALVITQTGKDKK